MPTEFGCPGIHVSRDRHDRRSSRRDEVPVARRTGRRCAAFRSPAADGRTSSNCESRSRRRELRAVRGERRDRRRRQLPLGIDRQLCGRRDAVGHVVELRGVRGGHVWECSPIGAVPGVPRPALGAFTHEAVAADPAHHCLYLTEDRPDGGLLPLRPDHVGRPLRGHARDPHRVRRRARVGDRARSRRACRRRRAARSRRRSGSPVVRASR